jgi:Putative lumazine-binding
MKTLFATAALILTQACLNPAFATEAQGPSTQTEIDAASLTAASVPVENYIKALETMNADTARLAFHKDARLVGLNRLGYFSIPIEEWMKNLTGTPGPDAAKWKRSYKIIDLTPTTGVAKVVLVHPNVTFIDHMALLKVDGEWKIVQKLSRAVRPPAK